jgi:pimeloyl-ACP methyl ester carboxylesterase
VRGVDSWIELRTAVMQPEGMGGPRWAELRASALPHARTITLEESGHMAHLEEPQAFADFVAQV